MTTIGFLEWDGEQWQDQPEPAFGASEDWEHGSVYEPNLVYHDGKWKMWYVAGSNHEDYLVHGYSESADGRTSWSQHAVFAAAETKMFDFCVRQRDSGFEAVFARVWMGRGEMPPETGLWWCREGRDFAFETTLASRTFAPWLRDLQANGYRFHLVYLCLPTVELAVARVAERVRRGGHAVSEDIVRRRYARSLDNFFNLYSQFANSWVMMDNSIRRRPRVIAKRSIGRAVRVFNADQWSAFRAQYERKDPIKS